jgi:uncharacterized protein (DUF342 family)
LIVAPPVKDIQLCGGIGVVSAPDKPDLLLAKYTGVFEMEEGGVINVRPYQEIAGDIEKDVMFEGDVQVAGTVKPGFTVDVSGSLAILGSVEGAVIKCRGNLAVRAGVRGAGGERATVECGGSAEIGDIENAKIFTDGCVIVEGNIINSAITAGGTVKAVGILGGNVAAAGGITATWAGGKCGTRTVLDVGIAHRYAKELGDLKGNIDTQTLLSEGYTSELYCFVRDSMDRNGIIPETMMGDLDTFIKNLTESVAVCCGYEEEASRMDALLKGAVNCSIVVDVAYPNVLLSLGFSEQNVKEVLKNIYLKPLGV